MEWALSMTRHSSNSLIVESLLCFRNQADLQSSCSSGGVLERLMSLRQRKTTPKMVFVSGRPCDHCCKRTFSLTTPHWREMKLTPQFSYRGNIGLGKARGLGRVWNLNVYPGLPGLVSTFLFSGLITMHINNDTSQTSSPKNVASSAVRKLFNSGELKASHLSHET